MPSCLALISASKNTVSRVLGKIAGRWDYAERAVLRKSVRRIGCLNKSPSESDKKPQTTGTGHTKHRPQVGRNGSEVAPDTVHLCLVVETPYRRDLRADLVAEQFLGGYTDIVEAREIFCTSLVELIKVSTYPVATTTTSALSSLPLSNRIPSLVKRDICASFLILILPSIICWHAPTSMRAIPVSRRRRQPQNRANLGSSRLRDRGTS